MAPKPQNPTVRYWRKVSLGRGISDCWMWTGATRRQYGVFSLSHTKAVPAHRYSYELVIGPIPEGLELDHLCKNKTCVNPYHLEPVTHWENGLRSNQISAVNYRKTHCPKGHPLSGDNLVPCEKAKGHRKCRTCFNERGRRKYAERKGRYTP